MDHMVKAVGLLRAAQRPYRHKVPVGGLLNSLLVKAYSSKLICGFCCRLAQLVIKVHSKLSPAEFKAVHGRTVQPD